MPPKARIAAPIDRPLSRAYLRKFTGWSTAHPPGASDPTSLRQMENMLITREGAVQVRPGLRLITRNAAGTLAHGPRPLVGTFETFYLNDGRKAHLAAVRDGGPVKFRVFVDNGDGTVRENTLAEHGFDLSAWGGDSPSFSPDCTYVKYVQIDNKILALSNSGEDFIVFHVGATKKALNLDPMTWPTEDINYAPLPRVSLLTADSIETAADPPIGATSYQAGSLIDVDDTLNIYNHAFCITLSSEIGESWTSAIAQIRTQRPWGGWSPKMPMPQPGSSAAAIPSATFTSNPALMSDQVVVWVDPAHESMFNAAVADGATQLNVYMMSWSVQAPVPVEMHLIKTRKLDASSTRTSDGYVVIRPTDQALGSSIPIPTENNRVNSSGPSGAAQGIVAADRLVLVNDKDAAAVVRWTTNEMGNYLNFAPHRGGGFKTLTSGNMQIPACVKLWQNPQSQDTLTILCMGTDGHSTSYYMAPATVTSQSDNTMVMGFEETTATPGTVSPYGCEVANNALYHPLDDQLMKSTASNYNINHKSMTDQIAPEWQRLVNKHKIVSSFHDQRLYYLVHNPDGEDLPQHCNGNEVWVLDMASEGGTWSRWLTPGASLRKVEVNGRLLMGLVHPSGVFAFDPVKTVDDFVDAGMVVSTRQIPWKLETNTQGANRAHDAWSHLQQANLVTGNQVGRLRYGIRGVDRFGQRHEIAKVMESKISSSADGLPWDMEDYLLIKKDLKEWFFFAEHSGTEASVCQITLVQYRYAPISVNDGYEYGSVETFEYAAEFSLGPAATTTNGIPQPFIDTQSP